VSTRWDKERMGASVLVQTMLKIEKYLAEYVGSMVCLELLNPRPWLIICVISTAFLAFCVTIGMNVIQLAAGVKRFLLALFLFCCIKPLSKSRSKPFCGSSAVSK
jgi:hypothetical protein